MFQTLILAMGLLTGSAKAQSTETIGVLHKEDIHVVQRVLFPKAGRTEIGASLGLMAFDPYLTTPNVQVSYELHQREQLSIGFTLGGGYGLKTGVTKTMESPAYGVSPYAFRYLASALVGVTWSPIYAKMSLAGLRVLHYDIYGTARAGATLEQSVIPNGGMPLGPTLSLGVGMRMFVGQRTAVRLEFHDDLLVHRRKLTSDFHFKQNANLIVGITLLSPAKSR